MAELQELLAARKVQKTIIIDDVFDEYPRPDELDPEDWTIFFDDLGDEETALLTGIFPNYETLSADELRNSPDFIHVLWDNRNNLPEKVCRPLFEDYEEARETERSELIKLGQALEAHGLEFSTNGSSLAQICDDADLVFVDLFLGFRQTDDDMGRAIASIFQLINERRDRPPLVVLMSSSGRLMEKRNDFRDEAGLLGSMFRVIRKSDLGKDGILDTLLFKLVRPYDDAKRVAAFVKAWDDGLDAARRSFIQRLRRLDLSDLGQIRTLLLDFEGQDLGEYLLDVADRVLQHEIESNPGTIAAALELSKVQPDNYRAPHLEGSPDLQDLVQRMIFQHSERLKLSGDRQPNVLQFGDILRERNVETKELNENVLVILTPACDLARCVVANVLVVPGILRQLAAADWSYRDTSAKVPIFISEDGTRHFIKWDTKAYRTIPLSELQEKLADGIELERIARLREICAIELQQRLLADIGRVGQTANPPATFPVSVEVFVILPDNTARRIEIETLTDAICYVGRGDKPDRVDHLVLNEESCDGLRVAINSLSAVDVHASAQASLMALKADLGFFDKFDLGQIDVPTKADSPAPYSGTENNIYMHVVRNSWSKERENVPQNIRKSPIVLKVCDALTDQ